MNSFQSKLVTMRPPRSSKQAKTKTKSLVNWLDLPRDVMIQIFIKLKTIDLLCTAQSVCSSWRAIAQDPQLYRVINLDKLPRLWIYTCFERVEKMARRAIDCSGSQLVEFSIGDFCTKTILYELTYKSPGLKCLRLGNFSGYMGCLIEVLEKLPPLEEFEFVCQSLSIDVIQAVGRSCPNLKSFRMNSWVTTVKEEGKEFYIEGLPFNQEAFAIAANLNPALESLHLVGNWMKNDGLEAVLGRFPRLKYIDLRRCDNLDLKGDLLKKCQGIKTLKLPNDSIDDYQFCNHDWDNIGCSFFQELPTISDGGLWNYSL